MPTMRWHPETGEPQEFGPDDAIPDGWLEYHPNDTAKAPKADAAPKDPPPAKTPADDPNAPLLKREVIAALEMGRLEFDKNATVPVLTEQLVTALKAALTAGNVAFAEDASPRALLALVSVK